jgi:hypothetical protein
MNVVLQKILGTLPYQVRRRTSSGNTPLVLECRDFTVYVYVIRTKSLFEGRLLHGKPASSEHTREHRSFTMQALLTPL